MTEASLQLPTVQKLRDLQIDAAERDGNIIIAMRSITPMFAGLVTFACGVFLLAFIFPIYTIMRKQASPSLLVIGAVAASVVACAVLAARKRAAVIRSGVEDLVIDHQMSSLILPELYGRGHRVIVPFDSIAELRLMHGHAGTSSDSARHRRAPALLIVWRDSFGTAHADVLARWKDETRTTQFAQWLAARIGATVRSA